ncbi:MAG: GNAT family N-acetyltransferase [Bacteroidota bacterium]
MIRLAKMSDVEKILRTTRACARHMCAMGIFQWNEHYPSKAAFENDIARKELYIIPKDKDVIAGIVVSSHIDEEYLPIRWLTETGSNLYIHRLFVHPKFQGNGIARQLMDFAEAYARKNGHISVRLDTFSQNKRNQKFYETRGYQRLGDIFLPMQSEHPFHCYELVF